VVGTVAWTVVANTARTSAATAKAAAIAAAKAGHPLHVNAAKAQTAIYDHALAVGFSRGFEVSAGIALLALIITIVAIRLRRADLAGDTPPVPGAPTLEHARAQAEVPVQAEVP
jgi:hypothetical protein